MSIDIWSSDQMLNWSGYDTNCQIALLCLSLVRLFERRLYAVTLALQYISSRGHNTTLQSTYLQGCSRRCSYCWFFFLELDPRPSLSVGAICVSTKDNTVLTCTQKIFRNVQLQIQQVDSFVDDCNIAGVRYCHISSKSKFLYKCSLNHY